VLSVIDSDNYAGATRSLSSRSLKICTLSELCAEQLRQSISDTEFIDRDAMESKELQLLYISDVYDNAIASELQKHERFLSPSFLEFLRREDSWKVVEMLQHEISVVIKGRSSEDFDKYRKLTRLKYGIPAENDADKGFIFSIFRSYQTKLGEFGQFDTDDVVLTTIGQLDTPIWRRRRTREGYDAVFIDETHLFNINELHLFHYFTKSEGPYPIIYSVDRSQAVGDRGWTTGDIAASLTGEDTGAEARVKTIFRSSVDIVNLAFSIVSSGATLFTNFDNPLSVASSGFTDAEEKLCKPPQYLTVPNEDALVEEAFSRNERLAREMGVRKSDILIVTLDQNLLDKMVSYALEKNKAHTVLKKRGDAVAVEAARQSSQVVLAHADYVGGLEFAGVILVGVDGGRVPPTAQEGNESSRNYLSYAAHNRLYVAVTRARYRVVMLGDQARGPSSIIQPAIAAGVLEVGDASKV
jgi:superfamily I DNA/RNA helicase